MSEAQPSNVVEVNLKRPNERVVEHIKRLLENAESGEIQNIIEVVAWWDGSVSSGGAYTRASPMMTMLGSLMVYSSTIAKDYPDGSAHK